MVFLTIARLKKKKMLFLIPLLVLGIVLPVLIAIIIHQNAGDVQMAKAEIFRQLHVWVPMFATWWTILVFQDFFEHEGNEILYLYHSPLQFLKDQCLVQLWYVMVVCVFFCAIYRSVGLEGFVLLQLLMESLFIGSLTYFLCFLFQNSGGTLLIVIAYSIYLNLFDSLKMFQFMSVFPEKLMRTQEDVRRIYACIILSLFFVTGGFVCSKIRRVYK